MGTIVRVKGIKRYRHPKTWIWYCYHRKSGTAIVSEIGSVEFFSELSALENAAKRSEPVPGTLGMVIAKYRSSPDWEALRPKTRLSYDRAFTVLKPLTNMPLAKLDRAFIFELRDKKILPKYGTWLANYTITVLSLALGFAMDRGWLTVNPLAQKIKKIRIARQARRQPALDRGRMPGCRAARTESLACSNRPRNVRRLAKIRFSHDHHVFNHRRSDLS
jgi:hypothetical protein